MPLNGVHCKYCKIPMNVDFCRYKNDVCPRMCSFSEMVQLTSFCIYKCMRIINLKDTRACFACTKVIGPKPDLHECSL